MRQISFALQLAYFIAIILSVALISFFPEPLQGKHRIYIWSFLSIFLIILIILKKYLRVIFSFRDWPLWLFLICMLGGVISAIDRHIAVRTYLYIAITFLIFFYIGKGIFYSDKDRNRVVLVICICSCLVAIIGLMELYFKKNILYENFISNYFYERYVKYNPRPMSTQFNPVILGSFLLGCLPFNFILNRNKVLYQRLFGIFNTLLCGAVIILTFSRGVFLGLISMLLFYLWLAKRKKIVLLILLFSAVFIAICSFQRDVNLNRFGFKRMISGSYDSILSEYRLNRINMTLKILKDHPFTGIGFNHFRIRFNEYCAEKERGKELYEFMIPDNMYLTFLAETGLIGTAGFLTFIVVLLKRGLKGLKALADENTKQMLRISLSALTGLLVNMGAYELFYWNNPYALFCLICGFVSLRRK